MMKRSHTGALGEQLAGNFLKKKGYRILETNYRCSYGEIDIVARQGDCLVFVEVRTKAKPDYGSPEESVNFTKKLHLKRSAQFYQQCHDKLPESWRIDLVAIELDACNRAKRIDIIENAVEE
jgi:putative endonuclease